MSLTDQKEFVDEICVEFLRCASASAATRMRKNGILNGLFIHKYDIFRISKRVVYIHPSNLFFNILSLHGADRARITGHPLL